MLDSTSILSCNFSSLHAENTMTDLVHIDVKFSENSTGNTNILFAISPLETYAM